MNFRSLIIILFAISFNTACDLRPLHDSTNNPYKIAVGTITHEQAPSLLAYNFKKDLTKEFGHDLVNSKYKIDVKLIKTTISYATQQNSANLRTLVKLIGIFKLIDANTDKVIFSGTDTATDSLEVSTSLYSSTIGEESTALNLSKILAQEIRTICENVLEDKKHA